MLYVFYGSDTAGVRTAAHDFVAKQAGETGSVTTVTSEDFAPGAIEEIAGSTSLFGDAEIVLVDTLSSDSVMKEAIMDALAVMAESEHTFVLIEETLLAGPKKKIGAVATAMTEVKAEKAERFNVFQMADALLKRDKKTLWILLQNARAAGLSEEEIIGTLWWQLKSVRAALCTPDAAAAGLKPFVYSKATQAASNYAPGEIASISESLLRVYHDGHLGKQDIDSALERWVLSV